MKLVLTLFLTVIWLLYTIMAGQYIGKVTKNLNGNERLILSFLFGCPTGIALINSVIVVVRAL